METNESQAPSAATTTSQPNEAPTLRLVIRARIIPEVPPPATAPQRLNGRVLSLVLGLVAMVALIWVGINVFTRAPTSAPVVSEELGKVEPQSSLPVPSPNETTPVLSDGPTPKLADGTVSANNASVAPEVQEQSDASPSPINEVIPDAPQSALQTIRGTVRVSVRVIVDKNGTVLAATSEDPGPSRYFERLALEAAKKWTFTPAVTQEQRTILVRFNFTREGTTARADSAQ